MGDVERRVKPVCFWTEEDAIQGCGAIYRSMLRDKLASEPLTIEEVLVRQKAARAKLEKAQAKKNEADI